MKARTLYRTREEIEEFERIWLAPYAAFSGESRGRDYAAEPHPYRTVFQRDRDRIIHTTAFRRLQYKTQVFVNYEGDYYRTRLTHTTEAAQIARTIARAVRVNEDLAEAITLAHDLGHSPFGHSGETTLDGIMLDRMGLDPRDACNTGKGFNHNVQTLRIVEKLERRWPHHPGLNLTYETREGIVKHETEYDVVPPEFMTRFEPGVRGGIEAQIVNYADELAYIVHDLDDGLRSGLLSVDQPDLQCLALWREVNAQVHAAFEELTRHRLIRRLLDLLVSDLIETTARNIERANPRSIDDVRRCPTNLVGMSAEMRGHQTELKAFLYECLYRHPRVIRMFRKAERVIVALFETFEEDYRQLPDGTRDRVRALAPGIRYGEPLPLPALRVLCDYIAGMTDRYALQEYQRLFDPFERA